MPGKSRDWKQLPSIQGILLPAIIATPDASMIGSARAQMRSIGVGVQDRRPPQLHVMKVMAVPLLTRAARPPRGGAADRPCVQTCTNVYRR